MSIPPLSSKGGIEGNKTGFKESGAAGFCDRPVMFCEIIPNAVKMLDFNKKSLLSIFVMFSAGVLLCFCSVNPYSEIQKRTKVIDSKFKSQMDNNK